MKINLTCIRGAREGTSYSFNEQDMPITLGRHPSCNVVFDPKEDIRSSSHHAEIRLKNDQFVVVDTNSTNGTLLNEMAITEEAVLKEGDELVFGIGGPMMLVSFGDDGAERSDIHMRDETTRPFPTQPTSE